MRIHFSRRVGSRFWQQSVWVVPEGRRHFGAIVRTNWRKDENHAANSTTPVTLARIVDGSSRTMLIGEKRLRPSEYFAAVPWDDRGRADGWDFDTMRSTNMPMGRDTDNRNGEFMRDSSWPNPDTIFGFHFGSSHKSGMNTGFADGSVRYLNYDTDRRVFDNLADRRNGAAR